MAALFSVAFSIRGIVLEVDPVEGLVAIRVGAALVGERSNFKIFLRTCKIMVMHSNEGRV